MEEARVLLIKDVVFKVCCVFIFQPRLLFNHAVRYYIYVCCLQRDQIQTYLRMCPSMLKPAGDCFVSDFAVCACVCLCVWLVFMDD